MLNTLYLLSTMAQKIIHDLTYMPKGHTGHLCPTEHVVSAWQEFYKIFPFTNLLEFGFNTGWSSALLLTIFPDVKITSIEILEFDRARKGANILKEKFPHRHDIVWGDSQQVADEVMQGRRSLPGTGYDLSFIDGGHWPAVVQKDIELSLHLGIKNFVFDDDNHLNIKPCIEKFTQLKLIKKKTYFETKYKTKGYRFKNKEIHLCYYQVS
jgi:hypothetical protein